MRQINITQAGAFLLLLSAVGLAVARPAPPTGSEGLSKGAAVLQTIQAKQDHVDAPELAKWLVGGRKDFTLIDLRQPWEFDDYHIPGAINVPMDHLTGPLGKATLPQDKRIILYSSGGAHAAQAWVLLAQSGYDAKTLLDGLQGWWRDVMTPTCLETTEDASGSQEYKARKAMREFFLGRPTDGAKAAEPSPVVTPTAPAAGTPASRPAGRTKGGGC
jgi:rhodanese-related sulfurtransferase